MATGDHREPVAVWKLDSGGARRLFETKARGVQFSFSSDETLFAIGGEAGEVELWHLREGVQVGASRQKLDSAATAPVARLALSPDNRWVAAVFLNGQMTLWNLGEGLGSAYTYPHIDRVTDLDFSSDSRWLAAAGEKVTIIRLSEEGAAEQWSEQVEPDFLAKCARFVQPEGRLLRVCRYGYDEIYRIDAQEGLLLDHEEVGSDGEESTSRKEKQAGDCIDGQYRESVEKPGAGVMAWGAFGSPRFTRFGATDESLLEPRSYTSGRAWSEAVALDSHRLLLAPSGGPRQEAVLEVLNLNSRTRQEYACPSLTISREGTIGSQALGGAGFLDSSGQYCLCKKSGDDVTCTTSKLDFLTGHSLTALAISIDPDTVAVARGRGEVEVFKLSGNGETSWHRSLRTGAEYVSRLALTRDGTLLAASGDDETVELWDLRGMGAGGEPERLWTRSSHGDVLEFSPDSQYLFSSRDAYSGLLWDLGNSTGQEIGSANFLMGAPEGQVSATFSSDSRWFAVGTPDGEVWLAALEQGRSSKTSRAFSFPHNPHGGSMLIDIGKKVLLADNGEQTQLLRLGAGDFPLWPIQLPGQSADLSLVMPGDSFAVTATSEVILVWDLDLDSLLEKACEAAARNFTRSEWEKAFGTEPYRTTCPSMPGPRAEEEWEKIGLVPSP